MCMNALLLEHCCTPLIKFNKFFSMFNILVMHTELTLHDDSFSIFKYELKEYLSNTLTD